jgi:hypothetical protein
MVEVVAIRSSEVIYQNKCFERIMSELDKLKAIQTFHCIITFVLWNLFLDSIIVSQCESTIDWRSNS